jgi:hypothetical protein
MIFLLLYFCMVKYLSFHNSSFALRYFLQMQMARPQCDTPLVAFGGLGCSHFARYYYGHSFGVYFPFA